MWNVHPKHGALYLLLSIHSARLSPSLPPGTSCLSDERQAELITHNEFHLGVCEAT